MLAVSGTVVNASVNLTRHVAATRESESDRAHVRFSDLLMCADLTDLRSTNRPNSNNNYSSRSVDSISIGLCLSSVHTCCAVLCCAPLLWERHIYCIYCMKIPHCTVSHGTGTLQCLQKEMATYRH